MRINLPRNKRTIRNKGNYDNYGVSIGDYVDVFVRDGEGLRRLNNKRLDFSEKMTPLYLREQIISTILYITTLLCRKLFPFSWSDLYCCTNVLWIMQTRERCKSCRQRTLWRYSLIKIIINYFSMQNILLVYICIKLKHIHLVVFLKRIPECRCHFGNWKRKLASFTYTS